MININRMKLTARAVIMLVAFLFFAGGAKAKSPLFSEGFESSTSLPTGWTTASADVNSSRSSAIKFTSGSSNQLTVNDGTTTNAFVPIYGYYADYTQRSEFIIPKESLVSINGCTINAMTFYANYAFTSTGTFQVYLKEVEETTFSSTDFHTIDEATTVYNGTVTVSSTDGMTISFDEDYEYGGGNLLVGFYQAEGGNCSAASYNSFFGVTAEGASISTFSNTTTTQRNFLPKVTFTYTPGGYHAPANLTIGELTNTTATLTWAAPAGSNTPTGYVWQYKEAGSEEWGDETTTTETTVTLSQLALTTTYDFRVKAVYDGGESGYATQTFTTEATSLSTPRDLACQLTLGEGTKATLSWTETGSATAWQICLNDDEDNLIEAPTNPFTLTGLTPETSYTAKVRAKGNDENSRWSDAVSFTPSNICELTVNDGTTKNKFVPVYGYYADDAQRSEFIIPATSLEMLSGCTIKGMKFYADYNFTSTGTFQVYLKEVDETIFSSTDFYTADGATTVYDGTVTVSATDGMTISMGDGYEYTGGNLLVGFYKENQKSDNYSSQNDAFYGVTASEASISSYGSNSTAQRNFLPKVTFAYLQGSYRMPADLAVGQLTEKTATLTWTAPTGDNTPTSYVWQYKRADSGEWGAETTTNETTVTLSQLTAKTAYSFRVKAVYADGESNYCTVTFTTSNPVYPIPFACNFEDTPTGELPADWTTEGTGTWQVGTGDNDTATGAGAGSKNALIDHSSNGNVTKLITPQIDLSSAVAATLSFMHIQRAWSGDQDKLRVYYRTSPNADWTLLDGMEFTGNISTWTTEEGVSLPNPSSTYQIAFEMTDGYGYGIGIDKVEIASASMPKPTGLTYTLTPGDGTVATLSWTESGSATAWQICLNDDEDNLIEATTNTYALTNLTPETTYTAKVRAVVSGEYSSWSDAVSFTPTNSYQLTLNDGTDTNTDVPIKSYRGNFRQRSEFIIPATSLAAIPTGRIIKSLKFYANHDFTSTGSFQVYLREVDETVFSSTNFYTADGATTVYTGTLTVSATDGMTISMDDGYEYEGGNLLVGFYKQIADGNASSGSNNAFYGVESSGASLSMWSSYTTQQRNFLPKMTISYLSEEHRKPQNLTVGELTGNSATLTWTAPAGEKVPTGYVWQCKETGSEEWGGETTTTETSVTLSQLRGNTTYDFRMKAVYEDGERSVYLTTSFLTDCGEYPLPYTCDFEDLDEKRCWTMVNCTENHSVWLNYTSSNPYARTGNRYFMFSSLEPTDGPQYLISPALSGTEDGVHVSFYYRSLQDGISYESKFKVGYSTTGNSPQDFTWGDEISCLSADYLRFSATYPTGTKYVAVQYLDTEMYYLLIDDFTFEAAAACPEPTGVTATATTTNGATISWTNGSDETAWDIYATTDCNDVPGNTTTPTVANTTAKPNTIENLASGTTYYIYVRAVKGSDKSNWSTPAMVDTKAEPMALPYSYSFEDKRLPCAWNVITTIPAHLTAIIDNENKANAHSGDNYLRFRRRPKYNTPESDGTLIAVLPEVDESYPLNGCQLSLWTKKAESDTNPVFIIGIMTDPDDATTFVQQGTTIVPTDTYQQYTVRFNEYTGTGHYIAIKQTNYGEACIDDIVAESLPACWPVEDLATTDITGHTVTLSWTGYSDAYNVSYRTAEVNDGSCESFNLTSAPDGWERKEGLLSSVMNGTTVLGTAASSSATNWTFGTANDVFDSHARINIYGTQARNWLITPTFTLVNGAALTFDLALTGYYGGNPATSGTDDRFVVLITTDDMSTWSILREWNNSGSDYVYNNIASTDKGQHVTIDLSAYAGQDARIAFYGESTASNADNNLHIDNVAVEMTEPAGEWQTVSASEASVKLTGLNPLTKYEVKVQGNCGSEDGVSKWSDPITFTTVEPAISTDLDISDIGLETATVSWTGTSESYDVKFRTSAHVEGLSENFDNNDATLLWEQYSLGAVDEVLAGTAEPQYGGWGSWETTSKALGQYNMALSIYDINTVWLITPEIMLGSSPQMSFDVALTAAGSEEPANVGTEADDDRFVVLVFADNKWTKLREWNNSESQYVFNNIATTGEHVTIDLSAYASKAVKIAFYGESTQGYSAGNDLHIDNVDVGQYHDAGEWQTVTTTETSAQLTGLTPSTKYDVKVVETANGDESHIATFTTIEGTYIVFAKEGYATYYNSLRDLVVPSGMMAHVVTGSQSDGNLTYEIIAGGNSASNIVPAGTAVLLQVAPADESQTIAVQLNVDLSEDDPIENLLHGSNVETMTTGTSGDLFYKLTYNEKGKKFGWYWGEENGAPFLSGAHKAWLELSPNNARTYLGLPDFDEINSVSSVQRSADSNNDDWYTIDGRKQQSRPTTKGIYLHHGRKVIIK